MKYTFSEYQSQPFQLAKSIGPEITRSELVPSFVKLLKDTEAEVRTAAAFKVTGFCELIPVEVVIKQILPVVKDLVNDQSQHVRGTKLHDCNHSFYNSRFGF